MANGFYVYFLTTQNNSVLYIGVTNNLERRIYEHKNKVIEGFTKKYNVHKLVYFECFDDAVNAITREKQLKNWSRKKKDFLVNKVNPQWQDLSLDWFTQGDPSTSLGMTEEGLGMTEDVLGMTSVTLGITGRGGI